MTREKKTIRSLLGIIFLDQTTITLTFPLITLIFFDAQSRLFASDTSYAERSLWYGLCVALPNFINVFFAPTLSALSDELGRKKILMVEIGSAFLFTLMVGLGIFYGILGFIFLGFIIRGAFSRTNPTALTIIGDTAPREKKILYMSYLQFAISLGAALGPMLGGYLANRLWFAKLNFSLPFFVGAGLALLNTAFAFYLIHETLKKKQTNRTSEFNFPALKKVILHPDVLRISLVMLLIQVSWSTYYQFIPPVLKTLYGFESSQLGLFIGLIAIWLALATGFWIKLLHRFLDVRQLLLVSIYLVLGGLIINLLACAGWLPGGTLFVWISAIPVATGDVMAYTCLTGLYSNAVTPEKQGKVMGINFIIVSSAWAFTGFLGGMLMSLSPLLPLMIAPLGVLGLVVLMHANFGRKLVLSYG